MLPSSSERTWMSDALMAFFPTRFNSPRGLVCELSETIASGIPTTARVYELSSTEGAFACRALSSASWTGSALSSATSPWRLAELAVGREPATTTHRLPPMPGSDPIPPANSAAAQAAPRAGTPGRFRERRMVASPRVNPSGSGERPLGPSALFLPFQGLGGCSNEHDHNARR